MIEVDGIQIRLVVLDNTVMLEMARDINEDDTVKVLTDVSDIIDQGKSALRMISTAVSETEKPKTSKWSPAKAQLLMRLAINAMNGRRLAEADKYLEQFQREISKAPDDLYIENMRSLDAAYQTLAELRYDKRNAANN